MDSPRVFLLSDSTGDTASRVLRAALRQFPGHQIELQRYPRVRTRAAVQQVVGAASKAGAPLLFTLVDTELRQHCYQVASDHGVEAVDIIGALLVKIESFLEATPLNVPSATLPLSEEYFRRVEAMEFAVKHDDGKEPAGLHKAHLVLAGVSRTSKTPLSMYLARRCLKVANVPLVLGVPPPAELHRLDPERVVGLTIDVAHLLEIRRARLRQLGMPVETNYGLADHVREELDYASSFFAEHGWRVVDVSGRAIEDTATIILGH